MPLKEGRLDATKLVTVGRDSTYVVMAEHHSFGVACGPGSVDEHSALIGLLARYDLVQPGIRDAVAKFHEFIPLWKEKTRRGRGTQGV